MTKMSKLVSLGIYIVCICTLSCVMNKFFQKEFFAFINYPCEKIQPQFPGFVDFIKEYEGKIDMIRIYEAQTPFVVISDSFDYNNDPRAYNISLVGKTKEQILNVFLDNGFPLGKYTEDVDEFLKEIDEKILEQVEEK